MPHHAEAAPAASPWRQGWYRFAHALPSPNFGRRPQNAGIDLVVIHSISLPPGVYGGGAIQQLFTNTLDWDAHPYYATIRGIEVSAHFVIERDGALWQFVSCDDRAWHAGRSAWRGRDNLNDTSIGIELEGLEDQPFDAAQYETLASLCSAIALAYPVTGVAGHEHIAPQRKRDPGAAFDWPGLQDALGWPEVFFPPGVTRCGMPADDGPGPRPSSSRAA
ncbi:MAG: 1,6-anhydro-N-acetylmuramyl-L-alanine amidase AmpD [Burkholderiaceae bacterium]|nr:1,6-anhydro-N-acetylmuramyl-L-alanine amidase AmpD [Burkholderiaceae bacterium]